jgi:hypothetical protein
MKKRKIQDEQIAVRMPRALRDELELEARSDERPLAVHIRRVLVTHAESQQAARAQQQGGRH